MNTTYHIDLFKTSNKCSSLGSVQNPSVGELTPTVLGDGPIGMAYEAPNHVGGSGLEITPPLFGLTACNGTGQVCDHQRGTRHQLTRGESVLKGTRSKREQMKRSKNLRVDGFFFLSLFPEATQKTPEGA